MNFAIQSTFNKKTNRIFRLAEKMIRFLLRQNAILILLINISFSFVVVFLYLENHFLPPVYGSKPNAEAWIKLFSLLAMLWSITTAYAFASLLLRTIDSRKSTMALYALRVILQSVVERLYRSGFLQAIVVLALLLNRAPQLAAILRQPKTHYHESKTDTSRIG